MSESSSKPSTQPPDYVCEECDGTLIPIIYGLPGGDLLGAADRGDVVLGGCFFSLDGTPEGRCRDCGAEERDLKNRRLVTNWQLYDATGTKNDNDLEGWLDDNCDLDGCWIDHEQEGLVVAMGCMGLVFPSPSCSLSSPGR